MGLLWLQLFTLVPQKCLLIGVSLDLSPDCWIERTFTVHSHQQKAITISWKPNHHQKLMQCHSRFWLLSISSHTNHIFLKIWNVFLRGLLKIITLSWIAKRFCVGCVRVKRCFGHKIYINWCIHEYKKKLKTNEIWVVGFLVYNFLVETIVLLESKEFMAGVTNKLHRH